MSMHRHVRRSSRWAVGLVVITILGIATAPAFVRVAGAAIGPQLALGDATVIEGDAGVNVARLTVVLAQPLATDTLIRYQVTGVSASSPDDFTARTARLRIRATRTFATIAVRVNADTVVEGDETIDVTLIDAGAVPIDDAIGVVTVRDDDPGSGARLALGDATTREGDVGTIPMRFTVTLDHPLASDVTARFSVRGLDATPAVDFKSRTGVLRVRAGRTFTVLTVQVYADAAPEIHEQLDVELSSVSGATVHDGIGRGTILDDDTSSLQVPDAPVLTSATAGPANGMLVVQWAPPPSDGGSPVTGYELEVTRPDAVVVGTYANTAANIVCGGPGATCSMRVRALNTVGPSAWSDPLAGTTWRAPGPVSDLVVTPFDLALRATWSAPEDAGDFPVIDYRVERSFDNVTFSFVEYSDVRATTVGCGERMTCWIRVQARNAAGLGPASAGSAMTWGRPGAPALVSIRRNGTSVGLGWTPPGDDGGTAIIDYTGERTTDGGATWLFIGSVTVGAPDCPIGLSCGFRVSAVNLVGTGAASNVLYVDP
jgi:hypothetical protein